MAWMVSTVLLMLTVTLVIKGASVERCEWTVQFCELGDPLDSKIMCHLGDHLSSGLLVTDRFSNSKTKFGDFPYYLRIGLDCGSKVSSEAAMLEAFFVGMTPDVKVTFQEPTHPTCLKPQRLEVLLTTTSLLDNDTCQYALCQFGWYTPMPLVNGSVVHRVKVMSKGLGEDIPDKTFAVNVNGYIWRTEQEGAKLTLGKVVPALEAMMTVGSPSRPLWAVLDRAPVLVLPGIPNFSAVLLTASEFQHTALIEVAIESPWAHSMNCPGSKFSFMIQEAIATESTIFIRQNQLLYRFTGNYSLLHLQTPPSESWEQVLGSLCISSLMPVAVTHHGREYFYVLGQELESKTLYRAQIYDGFLTFIELFNDMKCPFVKEATIPGVQSCQVKWAALYAGYSVADIILVELVPHSKNRSAYQILLLENEPDVRLASVLPRFLPKGRGEKGNSDVVLELRGMVFNPVSGALYLWGNSLLYSLDVGLTYAFFSGFPMDKMIKYFTLSYLEEFVFVTDDEELWWGLEGVDTVVRVRPSRGWDVFSSLQQLRAHQSYTGQHSLLTVFFDWDKQLQEVVYMVDSAGKGFIIKRTVPVPEILYYNRFGAFFSSPSQSFWEQVEPVQHPEQYSRVQLYQVTPPWATTHSGLQSPAILTTYSHLMQHILQPLSAYTLGLGDSTQNPIQSLWKDQIVFEDFIVKGVENRLPYMSSEQSLPDQVYLDRGNNFSFSIYITVASPEQLRLSTRDWVSTDDISLSVEVSDAKNLQVTIVTKEQLAHGVIFYMVTVRDRGAFVGQALPGDKLLPCSLLVQVIGSEMLSYKKLDHGYTLQGHHRVPVYVGCPPGKRMMFDLTTTLAETKFLNKQFFDCPNLEPGLHCFYFKHLFYPVFSIQDMVSGISERFLGSYTLKIVGGGPSRGEVRDYSQDEILKFNSLNNSLIPQQALVWTLEDMAKSSQLTEDGFVVLSGSAHSIKWLCQMNSPCGDLMPKGQYSPDFIFLIEISNKGTDETTYCEYGLRFELHIHGFPMNPFRKGYNMQITVATILSILFCYMFYTCFTKRHKREPHDGHTALRTDVS